MLNRYLEDPLVDEYEIVLGRNVYIFFARKIFGRFHFFDKYFFEWTQERLMSMLILILQNSLIKNKNIYIKFLQNF